MALSDGSNRVQACSPPADRLLFHSSGQQMDRIKIVNLSTPNIA